MTLSSVKTRGKACIQAREAAYTPGTIEDWGDDVPVDVAEALDQLRSRKGEFHMPFFASARPVTFNELGLIATAPAVDIFVVGTTLTSVHQVVLVDASSGAITMSLPSAVTYVGPGFTIKKIDSSANAVTIAANGSETIDETTTRVLAMQYDAVELMSDGTEWWLHVK
jgi:hypothetical protein